MPNIRVGYDLYYIILRKVSMKSAFLIISAQFSFISKGTNDDWNPSTRCTSRLEVGQIQGIRDIPSKSFKIFEIPNWDPKDFTYIRILPLYRF